MTGPGVQPGDFGVYGWITLAGIVLGAILWIRRWKKAPETFGIYIGAICGAFAGAKLLFFVSEGWIYLDGTRGGWIRFLTGKTILGALLGGYAGVEIAKFVVGYRKPTGDWFAVCVPLAIAAGRIGCLSYGCCLGEECAAETWWTHSDAQGIPRWPATPLELIFNLLFVAAVLPLVIRKAGAGQLFHAYMISYGLFRFWHEFHRATPDLPGGLSGYQWAALALAGLGGVRAWQRWAGQRWIELDGRRA